MLLNRYKGGNDYVGWHADDEKLYGSTPEIVSVSFGCDREFLLRKKPSKIPQGITVHFLFVIFRISIGLAKLIVVLVLVTLPLFLHQCIVAGILVVWE